MKQSWIELRIEQVPYFWEKLQKTIYDNNNVAKLLKEKGFKELSRSDQSLIINIIESNGL
jgi:hypothetical protein